MIFSSLSFAKIQIWR